MMQLKIESGRVLGVEQIADADGSFTSFDKLTPEKVKEIDQLMRRVIVFCCMACDDPPSAVMALVNAAGVIGSAIDMPMNQLADLMALTAEPTDIEREQHRALLEACVEKAAHVNKGTP